MEIVAGCTGQAQDGTPQLFISAASHRSKVSAQSLAPEVKILGAVKLGGGRDDGPPQLNSFLLGPDFFALLRGAARFLPIQAKRLNDCLAKRSHVIAASL